MPFGIVLFIFLSRGNSSQKKYCSDRHSENLLLASRSSGLEFLLARPDVYLPLLVYVIQKIAMFDFFMWPPLTPGCLCLTRAMPSSKKN